MDFDAQQIEKLIAGLPPEQQADLLSLLEELETRKLNAAAQMDFLAFIARVDRTYKFGGSPKTSWPPTNGRARGHKRPYCCVYGPSFW